MKTTIIWLVVFAVLIVAVIYLLSVRSGLIPAFTADTVEEVALEPAVVTFDQASVYTCEDKSVIAIAYKTADSSLMELSLPTIGPVILNQTESLKGTMFKNEAGYELTNIEGTVQIKKDTERIYSNCVLGVTVMEESLPVTASSLHETKWQWVETTVASGTPTVPNNPDDFIITFAPENRFSANTDCNNIGGGYAEGVDGALAFSNIISTQMACEGDIKEGQFIVELEQVNGYTVSGNELTLVLKENDGAMKFTKQ